MVKSVRKEMTHNRDDYFIHYIEFPKTVRGVTLPLPDGSFDIYINSLLEPEEQQKALRHELRHISAKHFDDYSSVPENEAEAELPEPEEAVFLQKEIPLLSSISLNKGILFPKFSGQISAAVPKHSFGCEAEYMAFEVPDDSMNPSLKKGELILLRSASNFCDGDLALIWARGNMLLRRIQKNGRHTLLLPSNPAYTAIMTSDRSSLKCFAVAEGTGENSYAI